MTKGKCLLFHRWVEVADTAVHIYVECARCGARQCRRTIYTGHQPVDSGWLAGEYDWGEGPKLCPPRDFTAVSHPAPSMNSQK